MSQLKCTSYEESDYDDERRLHGPCRCPNCGGFLKWNGDIPICNKCHAELIKLPDHDEETGEELGCGRICPLSMPKGEIIHVKKEDKK